VHIISSRWKFRKSNFEHQKCYCMQVGLGLHTFLWETVARMTVLKLVISSLALVWIKISIRWCQMSGKKSNLHYILCWSRTLHCVCEVIDNHLTFFSKNTNVFWCCHTSSSTNVNWSFRLEKRSGRLLFYFFSCSKILGPEVRVFLIFFGTERQETLGHTRQQVISCLKPPHS
jgi:hypothetical protein